MLFVNPTLNGKKITTTPLPSTSKVKTFDKYNLKDWVYYFAQQRNIIVKETLVPYSPTREDFIHIKKLLTLMTPEDLGKAIPIFLNMNIERKYKYLRHMQMHNNVEEILKILRKGE